ncbi:MAG: DUF4124 domain-containing protein [Burkholderiales bacterium]|nr:DUF4124 domain-containing protein [Burkholderiales bacterium]MBI3728169.1 DUF4124 domain-containing protein [Burkholderiales bacterium]
MKQTILKPALFAACLGLICTTSAHAEIYKWVDANGKVHYSEKKDDAGKAKVEEVKVTTGEGKPSTAQNWQDQEIDFRKRQIQKQQAEARAPKPKPKEPKSSDAPDLHQETDASRCALAKNILSGKAVHGNGAITDANDKTIAERDKSIFCH